jgi:hypothetical protein
MVVQGIIHIIKRLVEVNLELASRLHSKWRFYVRDLKEWDLVIAILPLATLEDEDITVWFPRYVHLLPGKHLSRS